MVWFFTLIFVLSCVLLFWSGSFLVKLLMRMARFLGWREFVVAFVVMAFAGSLPNLLVGINSALHKIPQLSLGDVLGGNVVDLTLAVALALLIGGATIPTSSRMVQTSAIFTVVVAVLPLILILDGTLGRGDGFVLLSAFILYIFWLFSKAERFKKVYNEKEDHVITEFKGFMKSLGKTVVALGVLLLAAEGVVRSSIYFVETLNLSIPIVGILVVGLGNALPEMYFAVASARKRQNWSVLGNLMGAVIVPATLVLGIVAFIHPIQIDHLPLFTIARLFLVVSALFFLIVIRSGKKITKKEGLILLLIYIIFVLVELLIK